jgi:hypothetical protein
MAVMGIALWVLIGTSVALADGGLIGTGFNGPFAAVDLGGTP